MAKGSLSNALLNRVIAPMPNAEFLIGNPSGPWPVNEPNANGEHIATVLAAWVEDGAVKVTAVTPNGRVFETFMVNVRLTPTP